MESTHDSEFAKEKKTGDDGASDTWARRGEGGPRIAGLTLEMQRI